MCFELTWVGGSRGGAPEGGAPKGGALKGGGPEGWGPEGWGPNPEQVGPRRVGPRRVGAPKGGSPKFCCPKGGRPKISRFFFPLPPQNLFFSSVSGGLLVGFWWCPTRPGRRGSHTTARELQTCTFQGPGASTGKDGPETVKPTHTHTNTHKHTQTHTNTSRSRFGQSRPYH